MKRYNWCEDLPREKLVEMVEGGRLIEQRLTGERDAALARAEAAERDSATNCRLFGSAQRDLDAAESRLAAALARAGAAEKGLAHTEDLLTGCNESLETWQNTHADAESRLTAATELLRQWRHTQDRTPWHVRLHVDTIAFLSTAPAQAAEPGPLDKLFGAVPDMPLEPAATDAETALRELRDRCAGVVAVLESGLQSRNYAAFAARVLEAFSDDNRAPRHHRAPGVPSGVG